MGERRIWQTVVVRKPGKHLFKTRINVGSDRIRGEERNRERERESPRQRLLLHYFSQEEGAKKGTQVGGTS